MAITTTFVKLPSDGEKQNKRAKIDPETWKAVQMTNDPTKFKVIDDSEPPINVAHKFDSQATAQQYIDHQLWIKRNPCPEGQIHDPQTGACILGTQLPFPPDPETIGFKNEIAEYSDNGERQELDIRGGNEGDAPHQEGAYVFYVKHNEEIGRDQYSLKWGFGGGGGEYEHITQLGGQRDSDREQAGWRWEETHNDYAPEGGNSLKPTKVNDELEGMRERVEERGLCVDRAGKQQGFMLVKTRSPNNDATYYDVYVDDMDGQGWKYAFSNRFEDDDNREEHGIKERDCCDQAGRGYDDDEMRLEVRFQDQNDKLSFPAANYKKGLPEGYISPLRSIT